MATLENKNSTDAHGPVTFVAVLHVLQFMFSWLIKFFNLSDEDRSKAGIYLGGEGRDDIIKR